MLTAAGTLQAVLDLTAVDDLWDSAFGRAITIKVLLLAGAGVFAVRNHRRTVPALAPTATGRVPDLDLQLARLRDAVRAEVVLVVAIFAAAGALGGYPPPSQTGPDAATAAPRPVDLKAAIGPDRLHLTVDPGAVGPNRLTLAFTDAAGKPLAAKQVTVSGVETTRGIGPLQLDVQPTGSAGTYAAPAATLPAAGSWRLTVVVRVSDFDEFQTAVTVPVR